MPTPLHTLAKVPRGGSLEDALAEALAGKPFNDMTFYTAQNEDGGAPRAVHANRRILMSASKYFRELLSVEKESEVAPRPVADTSATVMGDTRDKSGSTLGDDDEIDASESLLATASEVSFEDVEDMKLPDSAAEDSKSVFAPAAVSAASSTRVV
ncbi:hypothetical protein PsYK624_086570 [Phanerochaete sordida]|uniref:BTB domain-containing protein n=1 Tax=Phanerochaete sordida TaxID=48140 RepID=A0A9P3LFD1_9APHY|nr:hypothetical protein PsYK624_086570 [Phanerochaete sordida]